MGAGAIPFGRCSGCREDTHLPPFGDGLCFLCATDGPPMGATPTGGAVHEDLDGRMQYDFLTDQEQDRLDAIEEIFVEAQGRAQPTRWGRARWAREGLSVDDRRACGSGEPTGNPVGRPRLPLDDAARVVHFRAQRRRIVNDKNRGARGSGLCGYCHRAPTDRFYCDPCAARRTAYRRDRRRRSVDRAAE